MNSYYMNSLMCIGINCYVNWYMFYTNSHKRTCIYQLVYVNWYIFVSWIKIKKMLSPKKGDSPLTPGMWESVRSLPNSLRYHLFSHKRKPEKPSQIWDCTNSHRVDIVRARPQKNCYRNVVWSAGLRTSSLSAGRIKTVPGCAGVL